MDEKHNLSPEDQKLLKTLDKCMEKVFLGTRTSEKYKNTGKSKYFFEEFEQKLEKRVKNERTMSLVLSIIIIITAYLVVHYII